jgi:hypothetical protein
MGQATVIFQKSPSFFRKSTRAPQALSIYFAKTTSDYCEINPQSRSDGFRVFCKKDLLFIKKSTRAPETLSAFFAKTSSDFSQINPQSTFDYIYLFFQIN